MIQLFQLYHESFLKGVFCKSKIVNIKSKIWQINEKRHSEAPKKTLWTFFAKSFNTILISQIYTWNYQILFLLWRTFFKSNLHNCIRSFLYTFINLSYCTVISIETTKRDCLGESSSPSRLSSNITLCLVPFHQCKPWLPQRKTG